MGASQYVHVSVDEIRRITEKAFLVIIDEEEVWLPISQIADADNYEEGDKDLTLSITNWIANEKGLEVQE